MSNTVALANGFGPITPLDDRYYSLKEDEAAFFKSYTGIEDDQELKRHIIKVQTEAYAVHPYPCIRYFTFTKLVISKLPAYQELLRLGKERPGALFLDLGCCFGNDVRKAVADGFPVKQVLTSDLRPEFWEQGYQLFRDSNEIFPATFIAGDIFDPSFLNDKLGQIGPNSEIPDLSCLTNLTPLVGRLSAIHTSSLFHLFDEEQQAELARKVASLLSSEPGSIIFGIHAGAGEKAHKKSAITKRTMFYHSPESWVDLWENDIFKGERVQARATLNEVSLPEIAHVTGEKWYMLAWSVRRL